MLLRHNSLCSIFGPYLTKAGCTDVHIGKKTITAPHQYRTCNGPDMVSARLPMSPWGTRLHLTSLFFLMWSNKPVSCEEDLETKLQDKFHGIVYSKNFDQVTTPYQLYFRCISPAEMDDAENIPKTAGDVRPSYVTIPNES